MEKYNIGDKFVVEVIAKGGVVYLANGDVHITERQLDMLERLDSDYINEHYGDLQDEAYNIGVQEAFELAKKDNEKAYVKGLEDAWELAKKIWHTPSEELQEIYGYNYSIDVMEGFTANIAAKMLEQRNFMGGDILRCKTNEDFCVCVLRTGKSSFTGITETGNVYESQNMGQWEKTGKHVEIKDMLGQVFYGV